MIRFACHCKHVFTLEDDMAGGLMQCPQCSRLNDVPTLGDLPNLTEEGTYKLDQQLAEDPDARVAELGLVFSKKRTDAQGVEIDLRTSLEDLGLTGDIPLKSEPVAPKYDPVTGELIRPIEIKPDADADIDPASIPVASQAINYATRGLEKRVTPARILLELFMPVNLFVMFCIVLALLIGSVAIFPLLPFLFLLGINGYYVNILFWLTISHYVNTIDETGPQARDELPRPLRELNWSDDIAGPLFRAIMAFALSYAPLIIFRLFQDRRALPEWMAIALYVLGSLLFPAVLLTTSTSGSILNLRPDRVWGVMRRIGRGYLVAAALWTLLFPLFLRVMLLTSIIDFSAIFPERVVDQLKNAAVSISLMLLCIYLMHFFAWFLGMMYRAHHDEFPWVLQHYIRTSPATPIESAVAPPKDTKTRLRELREMEKKRREQQKREFDESLHRWNSGGSDLSNFR